MATVPKDDDFVSDLPDLRDLPLDAPVNDAFARAVAKRAGLIVDDSRSTVSAFNSSI